MAIEMKPRRSRRNRRARRRGAGDPCHRCSVPEVGTSSAPSRLSKVLLPEPELPITERNWPRGTASETSPQRPDFVLPAPVNLLRVLHFDHRSLKRNQSFLLRPTLEPVGQPDFDEPAGGLDDANLEAGVHLERSTFACFATASFPHASQLPSITTAFDGRSRSTLPSDARRVAPSPPDEQDGGRRQPGATVRDGPATKRRAMSNAKPSHHSGERRCRRSGSVGGESRCVKGDCCGRRPDPPAGAGEREVGVHVGPPPERCARSR